MKQKIKVNWADLSMCHPAETVLKCVIQLDQEKFGDLVGKHALVRRNARYLGALITFADITVANAGKLIDCNKDTSWNLSKKWCLLDDESKNIYLKAVKKMLVKNG